MSNAAPDVGPFPLAKVFFLLFGVAFVVLAIGQGLDTIMRAEQDRAAHEEYHSRWKKAISES